MQLRPEELRANGLRFHSSIQFESINQFVQDRLQRRSVLLTSYWLCVIASVFMLSYVLWRQEDFSLGLLIGGVSLGIAGFVGIALPIHEGIHGLVYKLLGAHKISFHADWKRMFFFAAADQFVLNKREFMMVAVTPFLVLTSALVAGIFLTSGLIQLAVAAMLVLHTGGCIGDFTLIDYTLSIGESFCTYDDLQKQETVFYHQ